jgi:hypothetical protein
VSDPDRESTVPLPARQLDAFLGTWTVAGSMTMGGNAAKVAGRWGFRRVADDHGLKTTMQTTIEGFGTFAEAELIGFDPGEGRIHLFSLNKFAVRDHVGGWREDGVLYVEYTGVQDGKRCREGITIVIEGDHMHADIVETLDGEVTTTTTLSLVREAGILPDEDSDGTV